jgi:CHASE3 domain sensor protein
MKFRDLAATAAALMVSAPAFAQNAEVGRVSTRVADASQMGGDSTILLIIAILLIGVGVALMAGNNSDRPSSP